MQQYIFLYCEIVCAILRIVFFDIFQIKGDFFEKTRAGWRKNASSSVPVQAFMFHVFSLVMQPASAPYSLRDCPFKPNGNLLHPLMVSDKPVPHFTQTTAQAPEVELWRPRLYRQNKKPPMQEILSFKRSGAASAVPLRFYSGYAHGCRSECICRADRWLLWKFSACACKYTLFSEWRRNFLPLHCHMDSLFLTLTVLSRKIELA